MKRNENIEKELKEISSELANFPFVSAHTIPPGYFDGLEKSIIEKIQNGTISDRLDATEELKLLSPVLSDIIHKNTYQVDVDYFEKNAARLVSRSNQSVAPVIQFPLRKRIVQLAVAASFIGLIGFFIYLYLKPDQNSRDLVKKGLQIQTEEAFDRYLANVNEDEIIAYLDQHYLPSDKNAIGGFIDVNDLPDEEAYLEEVMIGNN
jgi:hypothetical protein